MAQADSASISNIVLIGAIALAQDGCSFGWAAQVFCSYRCFAEHGKSSPLMAGAPVEALSLIVIGCFKVYSGPGTDPSD